MMPATKNLITLILILLDVTTMDGAEIQKCISTACNDLGSNIATSLNHNVSPCSDFYEFSCKTTTTKSKEFSLKEVEKALDAKLTRLLGQSAKPEEPLAIQKVKDVFSACMNQGERQKRANNDLKLTIEELGGWPILNNGAPNPSTASWEYVAGRLRQVGYSPLVQISVSVDSRNLNRHIVVVNSIRPDILPEDIMNYLGLIAAHSTFLRQVVKLLGSTDDDIPRKDIKELLRFQMKVNQISTRNQTRHKAMFQNNVRTVNQLIELTSGKINWLTYLNTIFHGIRTFDLDDQVLVLNEDYIKNLAELVGNTEIGVIKNYLIWYFIKDVAEDGDSRMMALNDLLTGRHNTANETCIKEVKGFLGFAVSSLYVTDDKNDHHDRIQMAREIVNWIKVSFEDLIGQSSWMDTSTKTEAKKKLRNMTPKIGYPEWVLQSTKLDEYYQRINVTRTNHFSNVLHLSVIHSLEELSLINDVPDHDRWVISPLLVNAFYHQTLNDIYIPVTLLQRPFLDLQWPMAAVFGGIGAVIGHEITHGFDDESLYAARGQTLTDLWSTDTMGRYNKAAECVIRQYDNYCLTSTSGPRSEATACVNGQRTLRENVADIGGISAAYKAYQKWKTATRNNVERMPSQLTSYTPNQLFFLNLAQVWCEDLPQDALVFQMKTLNNSPNKYRLMGSIRNLDEFNVTFSCKTMTTTTTTINITTTAPMNEDDDDDRSPKCGIW